MQTETEPAAAGKNFSEKILLILLILLAAGITFRVFYRGAYRWQDDLVWQAGAAVRSLRPHEKAKANAATTAGVRGRKIV